MLLLIKAAHIAHVTLHLHESTCGSPVPVQLHNFAHSQQKCQGEGLSGLHRFLLVDDAASGASTCYTFELWLYPYFPSFHPKYLLESSRLAVGEARRSKQFDSELENVGRA